MAEVNPKAYPLADAQLTITILDIVQQAAVRAIQSPFLGFFGAANRVSRFSRLRLHTKHTSRECSMDVFHAISATSRPRSPITFPPFSRCATVKRRAELQATEEGRERSDEDA